MKGLNGQSMSELVSLTVLALMVIALIGAQAGATVSVSATATAAHALPGVTATLPARPAAADRLRMAVTIDDMRLDVDFESLAILFAIGDAATRSRGEVRIAVGRDD